MTEWGLLFEIHEEEAELRDQGLSPDEIEDVIANRGTPEPAEGGLLDVLLGDEAALARHQRILDEVALDEDDDEEE